MRAEGGGRVQKTRRDDFRPAFISLYVDFFNRDEIRRRDRVISVPHY